MAALLEDLRLLMGDRQAVLAREMTKLHEEFIRGPLTEIQAQLAGRPEIKGECTLLVEGASPAPPPSETELAAALRQALSQPGARVSSVSKTLARQYGLPRRTVYELALEIETTIGKPSGGS